ncbi:molybdate ABC transporter substrate-binding protein [Micromonospora sp. CA-111912]|uniref:molybdate ABC transporter substrate-binding protein n=1 Tax=Micromonospora sp. CA-111912 TaxID=3239955 RepID=UPI003D9298F2
MTARGNPGTRRTRAALTGAVALAIAVTGCAGGSDPSAGGDGMRGSVTVFAAASLTESFTRLGAEFEAAHPGTTVTFSFAGSSALATQVNQGAPADVFAAASPATMRTVTDAGNADGPPVTFARNQLVIAVPEGNPRSVAGLADLTRPGTKVALCAPQVPCGAAARTALDAAGVPLTPVTLEQDVRGALSKLRLGEVDAALVYRTDAAAASEVDAVEFPESAEAVNDYPIVVLRQAGNPAAAREFVAYVRSDRGRAALTAAGFQPPRA